MKKIFSIIAILSMVLPYFGQGPILVHASTNIFSDGFESESEGFMNWTSGKPENGNWTNDSSGHNGKAARVKGSNDITKTLYKDISTVGFENIVLKYFYKTDGDFESSGSNRDDFYVEWWDGDSWEELMHLVGPTEVDWTQKTHILPAGANNNPNFKFRFRIKLTAATENIYIDDVSLAGDQIEEVDPEVPPAPVCNPEVNLIENGSFEDDAVTDPALWQVFTNIEGWSLGWKNTNEGAPAPKIELHRGVNGWSSANLAQHAELDGDWYGPSNPGQGGSTKIWQDIATIPGKTYELNFAFSPRPNTPNTDNVLGVMWGGADVSGTPVSLVGAGNVNWTNHSHTLVATTSITRVLFEDRGTENSVGTFLDNVSLNCVKEKPCEPTSGNIVSDENTKVTFVDINGTTDDSEFDSKLITVVPAIQALASGVWTADVGDSDAKWIWSNDPYDPNWEVDKWVTFTREFQVNGTPSTGTLKIASDNSYEVWVNNTLVGGDATENNHSVADEIVIDPSVLVNGTNTLKIVVKNWQLLNNQQQNNPGGLLYNLSWTTTCGGGNGDEEEEPDAYVDIEKGGSYNHETGIVTFNIEWEVEDGLAEDLVITDQIPAGLTFVSADNGGTESGGVVTWNLGDKENAIGTVSFTAKLDAFTTDIMWANGALENNQGKRKDGSDVLGDRSVLSSMFGVAQTTGNPSDTVVPGSFFSLGFDQGSVVLTFPGTVINGSGYDIQVFEVTGGTYPDEKVKIEAWDPVDEEWVTLGTVSKDGTAELSPLTHTTAIRLTEASDKNLFENTADGYDVDAVKVMNILPEVCDIDNTASFTAKTNDKDLSGNDSYTLVVNPYCGHEYDGEDGDGDDEPKICEEGFVLEGESCVPDEDGEEGEGDDEDGGSNPPPAAQSTPIPGSRRRDVSGVFSSGVGQVLGASTDENLTCEPYLKEYIKFGANNNPEEVKKLQIFLNQFFELDNPVTGFYGPITFEMVKKFQAHQEAGTLTPWMVAGVPTDGPTGYVYKTTQRWINILKCPQLILTTPIPNLP